jgi:hypothetical protein
MASASIYPSNMGISKLTCTLKGDVTPKWPLDENTTAVINRHSRMWEKFSIISSLCHVELAQATN